MNLASYLQRSAAAHPEAPAVLVGAELRLNYGQLAHRTAALAGYLREVLGVRPGDRVAIFAGNCLEYLEALHAILWAGAVSVPVNYKLHPKELEHVLADSGSCVLLVSEDLASGLTALSNPPGHVVVLGGDAYTHALSHAPAELVERSPHDLASLFYTSGTTGRPKGVMQTHLNLQAMTLCYIADVDEVDVADVMVYAAPMSHGAGLYNYVHMLRGARHLIPSSGGFDCGELVELAGRVGRLTMFAAPTMVKRLVDHVVEHAADPAGFKTIVYGGGPMYVEDIQQALSVFGPRFVQIYGQGECPMAITALSRAVLAGRNDARWTHRIASVGVRQSLVEVRILDQDGQPCGEGQAGEVVVRGTPVMPGYWGNEDASRKTLRDGWLFTGDIGLLDADGFLTLRDRSKDLIISGGSNIYPREVEEVLLTHPAVAEVAVVGVQDADWGEVPVAFVVARPGHALESQALDALCLDNLARFKRPKSYRLVPSLPKNSYGKVLKTELRQQLAAA